MVVHRRATSDEIIQHHTSHIKHGMKVRFEHFTKELYAPRAKNGVRHQRHSTSKLYVIDGHPHVKHHGKFEKVTGTMGRLDNGKEFIHNLRLDSPHLKTPFNDTHEFHESVNEQGPMGAQRYYMHASAHDQAAQKFAISSKSVDPSTGKTHRKLGRLHKQIAASLNQIAGLHASSDFNRVLQKKKETMANRKMNEEMIDEAEGFSDSNHWDLYMDHPKFKEADAAMHAGWKHVKSLSHPTHAENHMGKIMKKYQHVGAADTEPRAILHGKMKNHFGKAYKRSNYFDTDHRGKFLGEDVFGEEMIDESTIPQAHRKTHKKLISTGYKHTYHPPDLEDVGDAENGPKVVGHGGYHHYTKKGETHDHYIDHSGHAKVKKVKRDEYPPFQPGENSKAYKEYQRSASAKHEDYEGDDMADIDDTILEDEIFEDEEFVTEASDDLLAALYESRPGDFTAIFTEMIRERALDKVEDMKAGIAHLTFNEAVDAEEKDDDDADEDAPDQNDGDTNEEVEQVDELHGKGQLGLIQAAHADKEKIAARATRHYNRHGKEDDAEAYDAKASYHAVSQERAQKLRQGRHRDRKGLEADREHTRVTRDRWNGLRNLKTTHANEEVQN